MDVGSKGKARRPGRDRNASKQTEDGGSRRKADGVQNDSSGTQSSLHEQDQEQEHGKAAQGTHHAGQGGFSQPEPPPTFACPSPPGPPSPFFYSPRLAGCCCIWVSAPPLSVTRPSQKVRATVFHTHLH